MVRRSIVVIAFFQLLDKLGVYDLLRVDRTVIKNYLKDVPRMFWNYF